MRAGRLEEAEELTARIGKEIKQRKKVHLNHVDDKSDVKTLWTAVRQLVGRKQDTNKVEGITAESLNSQYAAVSTDKGYLSPSIKHTILLLQTLYISLTGRYSESSTL